MYVYYFFPSCQNLIMRNTSIFLDCGAPCTLEHDLSEQYLVISKQAMV